MKYALLLLAVLAPYLSMGQNDRADDVPLSPAAAYAQQQLSAQVLKQLDKIDWAHAAQRPTASGAIYTIPVVVHVLHNYGPELVPDTGIYKMITKLNGYFLKTNADTVNIIDKFKPVAANTQIEFKLATIDPAGNPTKGIEHIFTYLTYTNTFFEDQSKINQWPQSQYLNMWLVNTLPYTYEWGTYWTPVNASYYPYYDGILMLASSIGYGLNMSEIFAGYLNLPRPCSCCGSDCNDNDHITDTPPCGTIYSCANVYDTVCDTPNAQNIMSNEDTACAIMFTYGQGQYMQSVLQLDFGNRDSLVTPFNFAATGMNQPMPDLPPVADFGVSNYTNTQPLRFFCQGQNLVFRNASWGDTLTSAAWTFSNSATTPASTSMTYVTNRFGSPGWVHVSLTVTGNNTGTTTIDNTQALYVADTAPLSATGYYQEFGPRDNLYQWPMFNYYNNSFKWQQANVGFYDNSCMAYNGFDSRTFPANTTGTPQGDIDDLFTPVFDLTGVGSNSYLNFMSSGATATANPHFMNDSLEIEYSADHANSWHWLHTLKKEALANKGTLAIPYEPLWMGDWVPQAIPLPDAAITAHTIFRFRYFPGADSTGISTGNNFYLDRINFSTEPETVHTLQPGAEGMMIYPNPTQHSAFIVVSDAGTITNVNISVADITGKVVYEVQKAVNGNRAEIEIPGNVIGVKGLYLVHVVSNTLNRTEKLIVY